MYNYTRAEILGINHKKTKTLNKVDKFGNGLFMYTVEYRLYNGISSFIN